MFYALLCIYITYIYIFIVLNVYYNTIKGLYIKSPKEKKTTQAISKRIILLNEGYNTNWYINIF